MNKKKYGISLVCWLVLILGMAFVAIAQESQRYVPEHIIYRTLFHTIFLLNEKADEAEQKGQSNEAKAFRRMFRQDAELSDEHATILDRIAAECEQAIRVVDAKAQAIIQIRRAHYPNGRLRPGQQPLPPSPELAALQQERDALIWRYRNRLQEAFGETEWERFKKSVPPRIASGVKISQANPRAHSIVKANFVKASLKAGITQVQSQSVITGSTQISYDAFTNIVTAISTTELDFAALDWYMGRVVCHVRDVHGNLLAVGQADDIGHSGSVSTTKQITGQDQMTYSAQGFYSARPDILDPDLGGQRIDYWNFQDVIRGAEGGTTYWIFVPFYGRGPSRRTNLSTLSLGNSSPATVQAKPKIESKKPTFSQNEINVDNQDDVNDRTEVITDIESTAIGLQTDDRVIVEIITASGDPTAVKYKESDQVMEVTIVPGGNTQARFIIESVSKIGTYTFRTRIFDVQRKNAQGQYQSIYSSIMTNADGVLSDSLNVKAYP
jgi:hypothetical protein